MRLGSATTLHFRYQGGPHREAQATPSVLRLGYQSNKLSVMRRCYEAFSSTAPAAKGRTPESDDPTLESGYPKKPARMRV